MEKSIDELLAENSNLHALYRRILVGLSCGTVSTHEILTMMDEYRREDSERIAKERGSSKEERPDTELKNTPKKEERKVNAVTARLLIWHYYSIDVPPDNDSVEIKNAYHFLIVKGLIRKESDPHKIREFHEITEKGKVLVEYWLSTPIPIEQTNYVIPDRK